MTRHLKAALGFLPFLGLLATVALAPAAHAALGDCGQPVSTGTRPNASDALAILRGAVGLQECDPCICNTDGNTSGNLVTASDALRNLKVAVTADMELLACPVCIGTTTTSSSTSTSSTSTTTLDPAFTWAEVQALFAVECAGAGCHTGSDNSGGLSDLDDFDQGYTELVNANTQCFGITQKRVQAGNPEASFLMKKLDHTQTCGSPMPQSPRPQLSQDVRDAIRAWIAGGAPKNSR